MGDINSNSAGETEELIEKQEKVIDQLDKKRKVFQEIIAKGNKLKDEPKCPEFLGGEVKKATDLWSETNNLALDRLNRLRDNLSAWERYENKRNDLADKLAVGDRELDDIKKVYDPAGGEGDHKNRLKTAATIRKDIEGTFKTVDDANNIVQVLLTEDMKAELNEQVDDLKARAAVNDQIDEKLKLIDAFNGKLKKYLSVLSEMEAWNAGGRKRMDELLNPPAESDASSEDRVLQIMELGEDIRTQIETHQEQQNLWDSEMAPSQPGEDSAESKELVSRMGTVYSLLSTLNDESEADVKAGMKKASSLAEAVVLLEDHKKWQAAADKMKSTIDKGNEAAHKMSSHAEADKTYAANCKRWEGVVGAIKDWITKMEALVKMWESQAATADKVQAALSTPAASDMKLEDLEAHLNSLKQMFIEKQKMMDGMNPSA